MAPEPWDSLGGWPGPDTREEKRDVKSCILGSRGGFPAPAVRLLLPKISHQETIEAALGSRTAVLLKMQTYWPANSGQDIASRPGLGLLPLGAGLRHLLLTPRAARAACPCAVGKVASRSFFRPALAFPSRLGGARSTESHKSRTLEYGYC